jgi:hypothetical protein
VRVLFTSVPAGLDWTEPEADRAFPELRGLPLPEMERWWVRNIFFDRAAHPMAAEVGELLDTEPFDLVVRTYIEFGGWAAAVARDVPQVVFQLGQAWRSEHLPIIPELLTPVLGRVAPDRTVDPLTVYGDLLLLLHPASYDGWTPPGPWTRCRPPVALPAESPPARPDVLDGVPDRPVVLVTFGTVFNRTGGSSSWCSTPWPTSTSPSSRRPVRPATRQGSMRSPTTSACAGSCPTPICSRTAMPC